MKNTDRYAISSLIALLLAALNCFVYASANSQQNMTQTGDMHNMPDSYWKKKLPPHVYDVTRCSATEPPFTGKYWNNHQDGMYYCSNCGALLFSSKDKFDSGTGWPSFNKTAGSSVSSKPDHSHGMVREEIVCKNCGAHLGHLFDDGPAPTGKRYCVNSASLDFKKQP